jgi:hypothetical protein
MTRALLLAVAVLTGEPGLALATAPDPFAALRPLGDAIRARLPQARAYGTGAEVIQAMREGYDGRWPKSVTFEQETTFYEPGNNVMVQTWYEAIEAPGKLRIDLYPFERGNGMLFRNDSLYEFRRGSLKQKSHQPHSLLLLSRDVYFLPADKTTAKLKAIGFDLAKLREDRWEGRPAYVIGAEGEDDVKSPQFWIDKENLYLVRLLQPLREDPSKIQEVQLSRYQRLGGGWIETEVLFKVDGKRQLLERYSDVRFDVRFDDKLFDPSRWERPGYVPPDV